MISDYNKTRHEKPKKPDTYCAVLLIDGLVPLFERSKNGDRWYALPGGKPDFDHETPEVVLKRELFEELGVQVETGESLGSIPHPVYDSRMHFYSCTHVDGIAKNMLDDEHDGLIFTAPEDAATLLDDHHASPQVKNYLRKLGVCQTPKPGPAPQR